MKQVAILASKASAFGHGSSNLPAGTKIYGPYPHKGMNGRRFVILHYPNGSKKCTAYARYVLESHLGRQLDVSETVDHINGDFTDDRVENLQILSLVDNIRKSRTPEKMIEFKCGFCGVVSARKERYIRQHSKSGKAGPFCGRVCAGKASHLK